MSLIVALLVGVATVGAPVAEANPPGYLEMPGIDVPTRVEGAKPSDFDTSILSGTGEDPSTGLTTNTTITAGNASTFIVTYNGFTPQQQAAFDEAVKMWAGILSSPEPIRVNANFANNNACSSQNPKPAFGASVLGNAGPTGFYLNFPGAPEADTWYPAALASSRKGSDIDPAKDDICAAFNATFASWYFGIDGNGGPGLVDFMSVVMHELGHGLGFTGSMTLVTTTQADFGCLPCGQPAKNFPFAYDKLARRGDGVRLVDLPHPSTLLLDALTSGTDLYARGPHINAVAGPQGARLFAPVPNPPSNPFGFIPGSTFSHLDESTFPCSGSPCKGDNSLMTPTISFGEVEHMGGPIALAMYQDMGWILVSPATHYSITANTPVAAGSPTNFTIMAKDAANNTVTDYDGTVHFLTSSPPPYTIPANTTLTNGVGTFQATFQKSGTHTIGAMDTINQMIIGTSNPITVIPGAVQSLDIDVPSPAVAGSPFNFVVTARDNFGNPATNYSGTVHFTTTANGFTLPADSTLAGGQQTFQGTLVDNGTHTITATDTVNASLTDTSGPIVVANGAGFHPLPPARILDTRINLGIMGKVSAMPNDLTVVGVGGVPASGVSAVVMNVTVTNSSANSFLTAFPAGADAPNASNLNFALGETIPNLVVVKVSPTGKISLTNANGSSDVVGDVVGYYDDGTISGDRYNAIAPTRIIDTRSNTGLFGKVGTTPKSMNIGGLPGMPAGVSAVVMNVTVTNASNNSFLTVFPGGTTQPNASNLNFAAGQTIPNLVVVKLGAGGLVNFVNAIGTTDVVADIVGFYMPTGGGFTPLAPARILDTRTNLGIAGKVGNTPKNLVVTGVGGVPPTGVSAVIVNVTVTNASQNSFLTAFPAGTAPPNASNLNFAAGQTIPNLVVVKVGTGGAISLTNANGLTDVVADVVGWYTT